MVAISAIRDGLATRLATIAGLRVYDEFPPGMSVSGNASAAVIEYVATVYDTAFERGGDSMTFKITMLASKASDRAGREKVDGYLDTSGDTSVKAAVDGDLGGVVTDARVATAGGYGDYTVGTGDEAAQYLGVEFTVEVMV